MMLNRATGPECPGCGCNESLLLVPSGGALQPSEKRICGHCQAIWWMRNAAPAEKPVPENGAGGPKEPDRGVVYHVIKCPQCSSTNTYVVSTRKPIRHHKCRDCGGCFKSHESK